MAHIDYYTFPLSPFAYLAGDGLEKIATKHNATISYKPFALMSVFEQTGGTKPADRHPNRAAYRTQEMMRISKHLNMPINLKPAHWPTNPAPACYAIIAAQEADGDVGALVQSLLRAVWAEEKDIAQDDVVKACLSNTGFDPSLAETGLLSGATQFERNTKEAVEAGVFGTPTYIVNDQVFWGQDRLSYLDDYLGEIN